MMSTTGKLWHVLSFSLQVIDAGQKLVMPGVVDSHVHVNEPGRTQWEGYQTATRAAAAGGVTTIVDMPLWVYPPFIILLIRMIMIKNYDNDQW